MSLKYDKNLIQYSKELRKNQTPQEIKLWYGFLARYPVRFQRQKVVVHFIADFYCAKARLVIELDGGGHFTNEQMEYDNKRTNIFNQYSLEVLRFTNMEVDHNFEGICAAIDREVKRKQESLLQPPAAAAPSSEGATPSSEGLSQTEHALSYEVINKI